MWLSWVICTDQKPQSVESEEMKNRMAVLLIAAVLTGCSPLLTVKNIDLARMTQPIKYASATKLIELQPYDANKIPVLMIHGLAEGPGIWGPLFNEARRNSEIDQHYQFWVFSYASGYPWPYSTVLLRKELDRISESHPHHKKIVLIGHSMGGLIARSLVTDTSEFKHRSDISRVIFFSVPHRGSEWAVDWGGRTGSAMIERPNDVLETSIDTLSPDNAFVKTLSKRPIAVPYHSIIGKYDELVPYSSSHLDGAQSELIVPYMHESQWSKEGMAEAVRILRLNLYASRA
jgi:PGAP1-like protein